MSSEKYTGTIFFLNNIDSFNFIWLFKVAIHSFCCSYGFHFLYLYTNDLQHHGDDITTIRITINALHFNSLLCVSAEIVIPFGLKLKEREKCERMIGMSGCTGNIQLGEILPLLNDASVFLFACFALIFSL